ncbi:hypothetical protein MIR68_010705 [Amoeboaphelidium protococcarum]|nr:hypothetical protein MIR68_010705 [Amoeboaphelidium protococcarum]
MFNHSEIIRLINKYDALDNVQSEISKVKTIIEEYELLKLSIPTESNAVISDMNELNFFSDKHQQLNALNQKLYQLRLGGGVFLLADKSKHLIDHELVKILYISSAGQLKVFTYANMNDLFSKFTAGMTSFTLQDIQSLRISLDNFDESVLEDVVHNVQSIRQTQQVADGNITGYEVRIYFKRGRRRLVSFTKDSQLELTLGAHLQHYNVKKRVFIQSIGALCKDLKNCRNFADTILDDGQGRRICIALLRRLWAACLIDVKVPEIDNENDLLDNDQWKRIGFQTSQPIKDFRGMGLLGVWLLVYLAESVIVQPSQQRFNWKGDPVQSYDRVFHNTGWIQKHIIQQDNRGVTYPWAIAGFNVGSMLLHNILHISDQRLDQHFTADVWNSPAVDFLAAVESYEMQQDGRRVVPPQSYAFEELFCLAMEMVDRIYVRDQCSYMDFPAVLKRVELTLKSWFDPQYAIPQSHHHRLHHHHSQPSQNTGHRSVAADINSNGQSATTRFVNSVFKRRSNSHQLLQMTDLWCKLQKEYPIQ